MKHLRWLTALVVGAFLLAACGGMQAAVPEGITVAEIEETAPTPSYTEDWDGERGLTSEKCEYAGQVGRPSTGWIHWIFSTKGDSTDASLTLGGTGSGTYEPGPPLNANVWHFYTPFFPLDGLTATISLFGGQPKDAGGLVISDWCEGDGRSLAVSKTADTRFKRTHAWEIAKSVDPDKFYLYTDGSGDGTATWTIDVTYKGFVDSMFEVYGTITIKNIGSSDKTMEYVQDVIDFGAQEIDVSITCKDAGGDVIAPIGYVLKPGETITCDYVQPFATNPGDGLNTVTVAVKEEEKPYVAQVPWDFADATITELFKTVDIIDFSDLFGEKDLGTLTAASGQFTYTKEFKWADYGQDKCGDYTYDNKAMVKVGKTILDDDTATLAVHVQCFVFKGETVTGAGLPWSAVRGAPSTWFEYTPYPITGARTFTTDLIQGRPRNVVGSVTITQSSPASLCLALGEFPVGTKWELDESKKDNVKIQPLAVAPSRYLQPGQYAQKFTRTGANFCVTVPQGAYGYAIHLDAGFWMPDPNFP